MGNALISIVVPVYNVEEYLDRCVESIASQTYSNLEIILVDDGSLDECPKICDEWAAKDRRIKVIHKKNEGIGLARNTGIENATGEYICFFDSDDYVAPMLIEKAYKAVREERADIVCFGYASVDIRGNVFGERIPKLGMRVCTGEAVRECLLPALIGPDPKTGQKMGVTLAVWSMMFATELIRSADWSFVSERDIISEDAYSLLALYKYVQKVVLIPDVLYYYCIHEKSFSHSYRPDRYERIKHFYMKCIELCEECGYTQEVNRRCLEAFLGNAIGAMKLEVACFGFRNAIKRLRQIIDDDIMQGVMKEKRGDRVNPRKYLLYWTIRRKRYTLCYLLLVGRRILT